LIDFGGEIGHKKSSAQLTKYFKAEELVGKQVLAVVNLGPRRIGKFTSDVLTLGLPDAEGDGVVIVQPCLDIPVGGRFILESL